MTVWDAFAADGPVRLLRQDIEANRVAHAYLFAGALGKVPVRVALAFAASLICAEGGCGRCDTCLRVLHQAHPDVEVVEPAGMQLLVEQVRDVVRAAWRMPVAGPRRVIVVEGADRMNPNAQNAFLKALEEPPASTTIVLVAPSVDSLLETVRSRCREVPFHTPTATEVAAVLAGDGVDPEEAERWARIGGGLERATTLAGDPDARERRRMLLERVLAPGRDPGDALEVAGAVAAETKAIREAVADAHKDHVAEYEDWYRETKRVAEDKLRREQRRAEQDALEAALDDVASVLRDLLVAVSGPDGGVVNVDVHQEITRRAAELGTGAGPRVLAALGDVDRCRRRLRANANVLLSLEQLFLALHRHLA